MGGADDRLGEFVAQIGGAGIVDRGLVFGQRQGGPGFLKILHRDQLAGFQIFLAVEFAFRPQRFEFGGFDVAVGLLDLGEDILLVEAQEFLVAFHRFAIGDGDLHDAAVDFGAQFGGENGAEAADGHDFFGDVGHLDGRGGDFRLALRAKQTRANLLPQGPPAPHCPAQHGQCDHEADDKSEGFGFLGGRSHGSSQDGRTGFWKHSAARY